jgi:hypothetical protein
MPLLKRPCVALLWAAVPCVGSDDATPKAREIDGVPVARDAFAVGANEGGDLGAGGADARALAPDLETVDAETPRRGDEGFVEDAAPPSPDTPSAPPTDPPTAPPTDPPTAPPTEPPPVGITDVPCEQGTGSTLFRMHWFGGSHSADIDVWEANCEYSIGPGSACNALPICRGAIGCEVGVTNDGYALVLDGRNQYLQIRFDVTGLFFQRSTLSIQARSLSPGAGTDVEFWSPLYGGVEAGPIDQDFEYDWYALDWSDFLSPGDDPGLTAIRITPSGGAAVLGLHAVELCLE